MENIYLVLLSGLFAMLFSFWKTSWINKQDQGTNRMEKIGKYIFSSFIRFICNVVFILENKLDK